jgi:hypothetical protein
MSCADNTSSVLAIPAATRSDRNGPAFATAIVAIIGALQEALELRRTAHKNYPFSDQ